MKDTKLTQSDKVRLGQYKELLKELHDLNVTTKVFVINGNPLTGEKYHLVGGNELIETFGKDDVNLALAISKFTKEIRKEETEAYKFSSRHIKEMLSGETLRLFTKYKSINALPKKGIPVLKRDLENVGKVF